MISYQNPFRSRASEYQRDPRAFLKTFGPGAIDLLPDTLWDSLLVLRSAPGAGKTSLMRLFTAESLLMMQSREDLEELASRLREVGALDSAGPSVIGVLLNLERDYRSLVDVVGAAEVAIRVFFALLDVRIMAAVLRASLTASGRRFPEDVSAFSIEVGEDRLDAREAVRRLGGSHGETIFEHCRSIERSILETMDSLTPASWTQEQGHADLYSLRLLSDGNIFIDRQPMSARPLVMLDDGHRLARIQRDELLRRMARRDLGVARWYSERYEALTPKEILTELGQRGRDFELVELETVARGISPDGERQRFRPGRFERVLLDIGNRRAAQHLRLYADEDDEFFQLLDFDDDELLGESPAVVVQELRGRVEDKAAGERRYDLWLERARHLHGYRAALKYRELEILITRDRQRIQTELLDFVLDDSEAEQRSSSALREAAALAVANEFALPYYAGVEMIPKLGSQNIEQFLSLCGDVFAEMLARITLQQRPKISPLRQDRIVRRASDLLWREIPRRIAGGREVQQFIDAVVTMAREENRKPTVPYAPGVTGTALLMSDRERLMKLETRRQIPGAEGLFAVLSEAVANNIVSVELDQRVKGNRYMVIYLNRLLCPRFGLPLGRGGYRERRLEVMSKWMIAPPPPRQPTSEVTASKLPI